MILPPTDRKSHPFYARWNAIHDRCYNQNIKAYKTYGARGIKVARDWDRRNADGFKNFVNWIEDELRKRPQLRQSGFKLCRIEIDGDYGPKNCTLASAKVAAQHRTNAVMTADMVISIRRFIKENPQMTLTNVAIKFEVSLANLSRAARGRTWTNVNSIESPVKARIGVVQPI